MESLPNVLWLIAMFALRLIVPLLITLAIGYVLKRLDATWQAELDAPEQSAASSAPASTSAAPAKVH